MISVMRDNVYLNEMFYFTIQAVYYEGDEIIIQSEYVVPFAYDETIGIIDEVVPKNSKKYNVLKNICKILSGSKSCNITILTGFSFNSEVICDEDNNLGIDWNFLENKLQNKYKARLNGEC